MKRWQFWTLAAIGVAIVVVLGVDIIMRTSVRAEPAIWGTVGGWVTGIATVFVALLAARFAWDSAQSARRVVRLTAMSTKVAFDCQVKKTVYVSARNGDDPEHFEYGIRIKLTEDSTACFLRGASIRPTGTFSFEQNWTRNTLDEVWVYMDIGTHLSPGQYKSNVWEVDSLDGTSPGDEGNRNTIILMTVYYTLEGSGDPVEELIPYNTKLQWVDDEEGGFSWI